MSVATSITEEEYLRTSYPDREYRNGEVLEPGMLSLSHGDLQTGLGTYFRIRQKEWNIYASVGLTIRARERWFPIPHVCVYLRPIPERTSPLGPPFLWIEIISPSDKFAEVWEKARDAIRCGTPYFWIIEPNTLESELWTASGTTRITDRTLRIPDSPIIVPLDDVPLEE